MAPRTRLSAQTHAVVTALASEPGQWHHGYAVAKQTQLKSGTLYPILIRLAERGLLEACWEDEPQPGRPRRHQYRLTPAGLQVAAAARADAERPASSGTGQRARWPARGVRTAHASAEAPS